MNCTFVYLVVKLKLHKTELKQNNRFVDSLIMGEINIFDQKLQHFLMASFTSFDVDGFHAFLVGLVADLHYNYIIKSNRESSIGRSNLLSMPKNKNALGIVMEYKSLDGKSNDDALCDAVESVFMHVQTHEYGLELDQNDIANKSFVAIFFCGEKMKLKAISILNPAFNGVQHRLEYPLSNFPDKLSPILAMSPSSTEINTSVQS